MKLLSIYKLELKRLMLSKPVWLVCILCLFSPLSGYLYYKRTWTGDAMLTQLYIAYPVLTAALVGSLLFGCISIYDAGRIRSYKADSIIASFISPVIYSTARMLAMLTISSMAAVICSLLYLPFTAVRLGHIFNPGFYLAYFFIFTLPTWCMSVLFVNGIYNITQRTDLSVILYALLCCMSLSKFAENNYFMRWLNPISGLLSDYFLSYWPLRIGLYTRIIWICFSAGLWLFSLMCIRKYQKNLIASIWKGIKKVYILILAAAFIVSGTCLWKHQPFIDHGPEDYDFKYLWDDYLYDVSYIDDSHFEVKTNPLHGTVSVRAEYQLAYPFRNETLLALNPGYKITKMTYDGLNVDYRTDKKVVDDLCCTYFTLPYTQGTTLVIEYEGMPTTENRFQYYTYARCIDNNYITFGEQGLLPELNVSNCLASTIDVTIPGKLSPYLNYKAMTDYTDNGDGTKTWTGKWENDFVDFTAADMVTDTLTASDTDINLIYQKDFEKTIKDYNVEQAICEAYDYCLRHIGELKYTDEKQLAFMQKSGVTYVSPDVIEWTEDYFPSYTSATNQNNIHKNDYIILSVVSKWTRYGGLRCKNEELWSSIGFEYYSLYRIQKEKYGELYVKKYYIDKWQEAVDSQSKKFYNRHPEYLKYLPERYQQSITAENNETNFCARLPLMIIKAEKLVGSEKMDEIIRQMYSDCISEDLLKQISFKDFLDYCGLSKEALSLD
ncbi:MAG: hypothetical protein Q4F95_05305 [Oscillospiraceae bacterium]|nr:hypothetical protein [Oscillospiraceae bacterium]